jgi:hypothetical protein
MNINADPTIDKIRHISPYEILFLNPKKLIPKGTALSFDRTKRYSHMLWVELNCNVELTEANAISNLSAMAYMEWNITVIKYR